MTDTMAPLLSLHADLVYGPVRSRRLGTSLGVNVFPPGRKICNFNCAYCQYGWTRETEAAVAAADWPAPADIADAVRSRLRELRHRRHKLNRLTLAGSGEPTLHPRFSEVVERLRVVRDEEWPEVRLAVLSNAGTLHRPAVAAALGRVDEAYLKLDTGDPALFRRLNGSKSGIIRHLNAFRAVPHVTIQSLFTRDATRRIDNTSTGAMAQWLRALAAIRPDAVHVYTLDRAPAWGDLQPVPRAELQAIAERVRGEGIPAYVF
jgi:wyosine [tRNA(Phe)-imidazoG37] synthetase (radical SAM superfamily)